MKNSYSSEVKEYLCERTSVDTGFLKGGRDKKISKCCIEAFLSGALLFSKKYVSTGSSIVVDSAPFSELLTYLFINVMHFSASVEHRLYRGREIYEVSLEGADEFFSRLKSISDLSDFISCQECASYFLRGVFLSCGTVTDPDVSYHVEFITPSEKHSNSLFSFLLVEGKDARVIERRSNHIVYIKGSERISDFFIEIGAGKYGFDVIEKSIEKETRNNINRSCNCESANIKKTVSAFVEFKMSVEKIKDAGLWNTLSEDLRSVAELRLAHSDASLSELCLLNETGALSRSGLNHRLKKIVEIAKDL